MTDPSSVEIRDRLRDALSDAPVPHPWSDVERRATGPGGRRSPGSQRMTGWLVAAAIAAIALVAGFVLLDDADDDTVVFIDEGPDPTTTVPGWSGGELDELDTGSLRPLESLSDGDVVIPTGPSGWRVEDSGWTGDDPGSAMWQVVIIEAVPVDQLGQTLDVRMGPEVRCAVARECVPWSEPVTIGGVVWEMLAIEGIPEGSDEFFANMIVAARIGDRWVWVRAAASQLVNGPLLEYPPVIELLEGLRVGSPDVLAALGEACWECDGAGAEGDPFAPVDPSTAPPTTALDGAPTPRDEPLDGRPLTDLEAGDVVIATYLPPGLEPDGEARIHEYPGATEFYLAFETADGARHHAVRLWEGDGPIDPAPQDDPNHPPVEIAGLTWEWNDFESARIAYVGAFSVWVYLDGLDRPEAERFVEGLRAVPIEQYPGPIVVDGPDGVAVISDPGAAEVVATDERFEVTAVQAGAQVCTKLADTSVPPTMFAGANCEESSLLSETGIIDHYPLPETDSGVLVVGVIDAPDATAVRITSPAGDSVEVPTGPATGLIDGRFFLARVPLDTSGSYHLDLTIEATSP